MNTKNRRPNPQSESDQPASFLILVASGFYLLAMVWFLLFAMGGYGAHTPRWLVPAVVAFTVAYGVLMGVLWPHEKVAPQERPERARMTKQAISQDILGRVDRLL